MKTPRNLIHIQYFLRSQLILPLVFLILLQGCGGGSTNNPNGGEPVLMGGAIQGIPLNLTGDVTTLAGTPALADGAGAMANFNVPAHVVSDGTYLYIVDLGNARIRKLELTTGIVSTVAGGFRWPRQITDGTGAMATFGAPSGIAIHNGNLYVTDSNLLRKIVIATGEVTTIASGGFSGSPALTVAGNRLFIADAENHKILSFDIAAANGVITTFAGSGVASSTDGTGTSATFRAPMAITASTNGAELYVGTGNAIRKIVVSTAEVTTLPTIGTSVPLAWGMTTDDTSLFVTYASANRIYRIDIASGAISILSGSTGDSLTSIGWEDGTLNNARFYGPGGITLVAGNLYVTDISSGTVRKLDLAAGMVSTIASRAASSDGIGAEGRFFEPQSIACDGTHLFITEPRNHTIRKVVIATGEVMTLAGRVGGNGEQDGIGSNARFLYPFGITTDGTYVYVTAGAAIRKIVIASGEVSTLAGSTFAGGFADGTGINARFSNPTGITTDGVNLYVADVGNHTIRKIVIATGEVSTLAGLAGTADDIDGIGNAARFTGPNAITTDGLFLYLVQATGVIRRIEISTGTVSTPTLTGEIAGTVPVSISTDGTYLYTTNSDQRIHRISLATGVDTVVAGNPLINIGQVDGAAATARFWFPYNITTDGTRLFVADVGGKTVRAIR